MNVNNKMKPLLLQLIMCGCESTKKPFVSIRSEGWLEGIVASQRRQTSNTQKCHCHYLARLNITGFNQSSSPSTFARTSISSSLAGTVQTRTLPDASGFGPKDGPYHGNSSSSRIVTVASQTMLPFTKETISRKPCKRDKSFPITSS